MGQAIGNRYLQGTTPTPYADTLIYQNTDVFIDLAFLDHTDTQVVPTSVSIEIDDITNSVTMLGPVSLTSTGSSSGSLIYGAFATTMTLQIAASVWTMTYPYIGSQNCQIGMTFTATDSVTGQTFTVTTPLAVIGLVAVGTVSGQTP